MFYSKLNLGFYNKLSSKIILGVIVLLFLFMGIFSYSLYTFYRNQLIETLRVSITNMSNLIAHGLEQAMLENRLDVVKEMTENLSKGEGVEGIMILNKKGVIRISPDLKRVGEVVPLENPTCQICHQVAIKNRGTTVIIKPVAEPEVFRNVTPIPNGPRCQSCHNPKDKLNGVLIMDFSMSKINSQLSSNIKVIIVWTIIMASAMILVISLLMNRLVIKKLKQFLKITSHIGNGNLDERINIRGKDEMGLLADHFNKMTADLKQYLKMKEIEKQKEYLENMINSIDDGIMVVDRDYRIVTVNNAFLFRTKRSKEEVIGDLCYSVSRKYSSPCTEDDKSQMCPAQKTFETGNLQKTTYTYYNGETSKDVYMEIYCSPLRNEQEEVFQVIEVMRDITERKQLEAQLIHSERLTSLGFLASCISHEIKHPLTSILTGIEGLLRTIKGPSGLDPEVHKKFLRYLELIQKEGDHCKAIFDKLLILSRKSRGSFDFLDINKSIAETVSLIEHEFIENEINVVQALCRDLPLIKARDSEMRQVFLNIILNGIQAIGKNGTIKITTGRDDNNVKIVFEDTGYGIRNEDLKRVFEPFFTRKPAGKGTGLGLSICQNIIRQHNGEIFVESELGKGAKFTIILPILSKSS